MRRESKQKRLKEKGSSRGITSNYLEPDREDASDDENAISLSAIKSRYKKNQGLCTNYQPSMIDGDICRVEKSFYRLLLDADNRRNIYSSDDDDSDFETKRKKADKAKVMQDSDSEEKSRSASPSGSESDSKSGSDKQKKSDSESERSGSRSRSQSRSRSRSGSPASRASVTSAASRTSATSAASHTSAASAASPASAVSESDNDWVGTYVEKILDYDVERMTFPVVTTSIPAYEYNCLVRR